MAGKLLVGGQSILGRDGRNAFEGTIGLVAKLVGGGRGLVTAGHVLGPHLGAVHLMKPDKSPDKRIGTVFENMYRRTLRTRDVGIVRINDNVSNRDIAPWTVAWLGLGNTLMKKQLIGIGQARLRSRLMFVGEKSGLHAVKVVASKTDVRLPDDDYILKDVIKLEVVRDLDFFSKPGDSGGPVFDGDKFIGIAVAANTDQGGKTVACVPFDQFEDYVSLDFSPTWRGV